VKAPPRKEDSLVSQILDAAVAAPVAIGLTALGAVVTVTQWMVAAVTALAPDLDRTRPRHNAARVREQLRAAKQAARKAGVS
jgi:threonine/homoserine/homoserine lactone efflux protein